MQAERRSGSDIRVTDLMRWQWLVFGLAALLAVLLAYAWADGGREPLRTIEEPVPLPDAAR